MRFERLKNEDAVTARPQFNTRPGGIRAIMKMRKILLLVGGCLLVASVFFALGGCSAIAQRSSSKPVPYSYYTPITIGPPVSEGRRVVVPVSLVDAQPINSALAPYRIKTRISGHEIDMTVVVALAGDRSLKKYHLDLTGAPSGVYTVSYRDPDGTRHKLGELTIP
jgi:hypothetical protein